jgi:hypothetical protein
MSKRLYATLLPLIAVAAVAIVPAAAQAAPHFYKEGVRLPFTEEKTQIVSWGKLKLTASNGIVIECKVIDAGNVWNTTLAANGKDNLEVFQNYECSSAACATVSIVTAKLPYETELVAGIKDKVKVTELIVTCSGTALTFTGTLEPNVVNGTSRTAPTVLEFVGAGSGTLTAPGPVTATVEGKDKILGFVAQELITAVNP